MEPLKKPRLKDIDGTEPGKVQLVSITLAEELPKRDGFMHSYFEEGPDDKYDPWLMAEGLHESIKKDFPEHHFAIVGNWRARYLAWNRRMEEIGISEENRTPQAYLGTPK